MVSKNYVEMNVEELYQHLITDVMAAPSQGRELLDILKEEQRYQDDFQFRASIDTASALLFGIFSETKKAIPLCIELIERTTALQMWQLVSTNWNLLGTAYVAEGLYERGLECYHNVVRNEKEHGLIAMTSIAYNNIAMLYDNFKQSDKTYYYFRKAIETLESGGVEQPRYYSKIVLYWSNLLKILCRLQRLEEVPDIFEKINRVDFELVSHETRIAYYSARMYYFFYVEQYDEAKSLYYRLIEMIGNENSLHRLVVLGNFLELCAQFQLDYDFYAKELLEFESLQKCERGWANAYACMGLRNYYKHIGNQKRFHELSEEYIKFMEQDAEDVRRRQCESLLLVENLLLNTEEVQAVMTKNTELQLIAQEAIRNKNSLQEAYDRIELINELGRKMTASLNLDEVVASIYNIIRMHLPIDVFILMVTEEEKEIIRSVAYYQDGVLEANFCIDMNASHGFFTECYRKNRLISTADASYADFLKRELSIQKKTEMQSAIYMPLNVGDKLIGLCSIQDRSEGIYSEEHISFLEELAPYLSIALNNAVRSWTLEEEIQSHLKTQAELKTANEKLERISSLDGLTQISSRRDFDIRISNLLEHAKESGESAGMLMMDIDNFKMYNDTYGHLQGDEVLKAVARIIRENMDRVNGLSARFGGEEFIGACTGLNKEDYIKLGEVICRDIFNLKIAHRLSEYGCVTVSIGIAFSDCNLQRSELMRLADEELYHSKSEGKNRVSICELK